MNDHRNGVAKPAPFGEAIDCRGSPEVREDADRAPADSPGRPGGGDDAPRACEMKRRPVSAVGLKRYASRYSRAMCDVLAGIAEKHRNADDSRLAGVARQAALDLLTVALGRPGTNPAAEPAPESPRPPVDMDRIFALLEKAMISKSPEDLRAAHQATALAKPLDVPLTKEELEALEHGLGPRGTQL